MLIREFRVCLVHVIFKVLKLSLNLKYAATKFCFLGHLHAIKVSELNKSDLYYLQSDFFLLKIKKKTKIPSSTTISTLRI